MTCTHAALKRKDFLQLGFKYDNLLMEESAQILEIETFIPMLLQRQEDGYARLKRCILIGDHHQLPPVVKNMAFQKYSHMDQSLFTRFVHLGIPYIEHNAQGRARPSIAKLYNWRYRDLGDLPYVKEDAIFYRANAGFSYEFQLVDVPDYQGRGESAPSPWFYQNEGEAEYVVSVYMYLRLLGLVVAMSRARLGLYVFCRRSLFEQCYELQPTFQLLLQRPDCLALNLNEITSYTERHVEDTGPIHLVSGVEEMISIFNWRYQERYMSHQFDHYMTYSGQNDQQNSTTVFNAMDTDTPSVQHESSMEEGTKIDVDVLPASHSNGEVDKEASRNDENDRLPESNSSEENMTE
ncbi:rna helicase aquarius [Quercus suber]|uniref:Rna helicase aquarius n=1 Tax=Quercus suber TaxID=58331 RepID=A0AAW0M0T3_QUESU